MINELYKMYKGLDRLEILPLVKHNDITVPGKNNTFRVLLGANGELRTFDLMTVAQTQSCWSIGDGNRNQFPAIKMTYPLIPNGHPAYIAWKGEHAKPTQGELVDFIVRQTKKTPLDLSNLKEWPEVGYRNKINQRMDSFVNNYSDENFFKLFERFFLIKKNGVQVLEDIYKNINETLERRDQKDLSLIASFLFGEKLDSKGKISADKHRITFLIDTFPLDGIDRYATSLKEVPSLSKALFGLENEAKNKNKVICALTGKLSAPVTNKFPSEKLSIIGKTIIFAKSDTSGPTVQRYGRWKTDAYAVDKELINKLAASISFLANEKQKNKTWRKVTSSAKKEPVHRFV